MQLNKLRDEALANAEKQGFHKRRFNFGESLMLIVSELFEMLEADRNDRYVRSAIPVEFLHLTEKSYEEQIKGTVEEELADAVIRLCYLAGRLKIDLEWHVRAKMAYNETRPYKHGKKY
jgi:NTP pyrophosphatase (non-canonical NTP hydrolase)